MSKRVSNKTSKSHGNKRLARSQVKYGWKTLRLFGIYGKDKVLSGEYLKEVKEDE